jgi:hypothetical protein
MLAILLPKTVCELIDSRRRAFLWTGGEKCHGSHALLLGTVSFLLKMPAGLVSKIWKIKTTAVL